MSIFCNISTIDSIVTRSIEEIEEQWKKIVPANHHLSVDSLKLFEEAKLKDMSFLYVLLFDKESNVKKPIAAFYFQSIQLQHYHFNELEKNGKIVQKVTQSLIDNGIQVLVNGNLFRINFPGIYTITSNYKTDELLEYTYQNIVKKLPSKQKPKLLLLKDIEAHNATIPFWKKRQFKLYPDDATMVVTIDNEWNNMEDYIQDLTKKYAQRAKSTLKAFEGITKKELLVDDLLDYSNRIEDLYNQVMDKQTIKIGVLDINYFLACKKRLGDDFKIYGYFENEKLIAFSSNIITTDKWETHYIGIDYKHNQERKIYFNILLDGISNAIHAKKMYLELGRTAREAKAIIGAKPVPYTNYYRLSNTLVQIIFSFVQDSFQKDTGDDWKNRNPFKQHKTVIL